MRTYFIPDSSVVLSLFVALSLLLIVHLFGMGPRQTMYVSIHMRLLFYWFILRRIYVVTSLVPPRCLYLFYRFV